MFFNAFCALCNYDLDNTSMFCSATGNDTEDLTVYPPLYVMDNEDDFFWRCDSALVNVDACPGGSDAETTRRCLTYFAPVVHKREKPEMTTSEVVYKNVYCGMCNGADISSLVCSDQAVRFSVDHDSVFLEGPDITMLIRPPTELPRILPLSPKYGRYSCWIGSGWNQFVFRTMPVTLSLLFDIGLYVHIVVHARRTAKRAAAFNFKGGDSLSSMALL
ncbi:hypothetical protein MRX96_052642 [Rhipicephalus microplus]